MGAAIAEGFRAGGYEVPACTRREMDVSNHLSVARFFSQFDHVDVLVNNAGVLGPVGALSVASIEAWEQVLATNLLGPVRAIQAALPMMAWGGKIINIAGGGATGPLPRRIPYAASKAALVRLTDSLAEELRDQGIDVNAVLPGPLPTDMMAEIVAAGPEALGQAEHAAHLVYQCHGTEALDNAVSLICYLASEAADGLTGKVLSARFDKWPLDVKAAMASNRYTLRRVDG